MICDCPPTRRCFLCAPDMFPRRYWEWAERRDEARALAEAEKVLRQPVRRQTPPTKCCVCGVPSFSNYCDECWGKSA